MKRNLAPGFGSCGFSHIALVTFLSYFQWQTWLVPSPLLSVSEGKCGRLCCCLCVGWEVQTTPALAEGMIDVWCFLEMLLEKSILEFSVIRQTPGFYPSITERLLGFDPGPPPSLPPFWVLSSHAALVLEDTAFLTVLWYLPQSLLSWPFWPFSTACVCSSFTALIYKPLYPFHWEF